MSWMARSEWPPRSKKLSWIADPLDAEHLRPDRRPAPPRSVRAAGRRRRRRGARPIASGTAREGLAVELAVGRQRQGLQHHERRGHHVLRQPPPAGAARSSAASAGAGRPAPGRRPADRSPGPSSRATTVAWATPGCATRAASISPSSMRKPRIFTWWSIRPRYSSCAVGPPARQVARPVQASAGLAGERVGDEPLGRQVGTRRVAPRQPDAADVQLAGHAHRHRLQPARPARRAAVLAIGRPIGTAPRPLARAAGPVAHVHRRLGRPVEVVQLHAVESREEPLLQVERQGLAAADDPAEAAALRGVGRLDERLEHRGHEMDGRDPALRDDPAEVRRVAVAARPGHRPGWRR